MPFITAQDGTKIFHKDWGSGQPVVFSHGWPLSADIWDEQAALVATHGFRAVAHDRRGHGRSDQPWDGNDMDTYADDLAELIEQLDLRDVVLVGHSTGGGEVARYIGRHGTGRVAKAVLIGAVPPVMVKSGTNPEGTPLEAFDAIREGVRADRSQFYWDLSESFYGFNRPGAETSEGVRRAFWRLSMQVGYRGAYECVRQFSETDFTADLGKFDVPTLVVHGEDDQIVPFRAAGPKSAELIDGAVLKAHPGAPHGLVGGYRAAVEADLLEFIRH
ncbi:MULTISPECIES: alpha/beta fold hydrolase [unclassified Streptomyces]|uniref:alpha/beta fold hydrolase n=1 Tax=unclassified Streptomyces TaxID=2593676 RepID=UPI002E2C847B|nr:alpha/beta hydrolase [Streptomyces sp. NBC_00223]